MQSFILGFLCGMILDCVVGVITKRIAAKKQLSLLKNSLTNRTDEVSEHEDIKDNQGD